MRGFRTSLMVSSSITVALGAAALVAAAPAAAQTADQTAPAADSNQIVVTGYRKSLADSADTGSVRNFVCGQA